jgi:hypothetical protein
MMKEYRGIGKAPRKERFQKSLAILELEQLANQQSRFDHPGVNPKFLTPRTFKDDTANNLTVCIVTYITLKGGFASRLNNQGTFNKKLNRYIPSTSRKGLPDVMATYHQESLFIEVKIGNDRQSEEQKKIEAEQIKAGGHYYIARSFDGFKQWFDNL